jgi:hypothetical protein
MESLSVLLFFAPQIIIIIFLIKAGYSYFVLYRKKKNPDYPILPGEAANYIGKGGKSFFKIYLTPFFMLKIIFESHKDKELSSAVQKVRLLLVVYIIILLIEFVLPILTAPNLNFRWG